MISNGKTLVSLAPYPESAVGVRNGKLAAFVGKYKVILVMCPVVKLLFLQEPSFVVLQREVPRTILVWPDHNVSNVRQDVLFVIRIAFFSFYCSLRHALM